MPPSPFGPGEKLTCISYAPFHGDQAPYHRDLRVPDRQIAEDLDGFPRSPLASAPIRARGAQGRITRLAAAQGLKVLQGIWLGRNLADNRREIEAALKLARGHPGTIEASSSAMRLCSAASWRPPRSRPISQEVKRRSGLPVTYADVWEFWLRSPSSPLLSTSSPSISSRIGRTIRWRQGCRRPRPGGQAKGAAAFPGKEILIGEVGWPSQGRMRDGALPSPANQARVLERRDRSGQAGRLEGQSHRGLRPALEAAAGRNGGRLLGAVRRRTRETQIPLRRGRLQLSRIGGFKRGSASARPCSSSSFRLGSARGAYGRAILEARLGRRNHRPRHRVSSSGSPRSTCQSKARARRSALRAADHARARSGSAGGRGFAHCARDALPGFAFALNPLIRALAPPRSRRGPAGGALAATAVAAIHVALGLVFDPRYKDFPFAALLGPFVALAIACLHGARAALSGPGRPRSSPRRC